VIRAIEALLQVLLQAVLEAVLQVMQARRGVNNPETKT